MGLFKKLFGGGGGAGEEPGAGREVQELIARLDSPEAPERLAAAQALGELGGRAAAATDKLLELIDDPDGDVCNAAAAAYARIERGM